MGIKGNSTKKPICCLSAAGLDPTGGAGGSADMRVFKRFGMLGTLALTAITPQNTNGVRSVYPVEEETLRDQLLAILEDYPVSAAKIGQTPNEACVRVLAEIFHDSKFPLVLDPVLSPSLGSRLVMGGVVSALVRYMLPITTILTPNVNEAALLCGLEVKTKTDIEHVAECLLDKGCKAVVITGGDRKGEKSADLFYDGTELRWLQSTKRNVGLVHGTGCHYSAALCCYLAKGHSPLEAVMLAKRWMNGMLDAHVVNLGGKMSVLDS